MYSFLFLGVSSPQEFLEMDAENQKIYSEFRELIAESCAFDDIPARNFQGFHHDYLKFCFGVMKVQIDYLKKTIELWSPKPISMDPLTTYNINSCVNGSVSYVDFEATLLGCMEDGEFSNRFYKHLLYEYWHPISTSDKNKKSA